MDHGTIKEVTKFLYFPLTIEGITKWWTTETYVKRYEHEIHNYNGEWKYLHWGPKKDKYDFNDLTIEIYDY